MRRGTGTPGFWNIWWTLTVLAMIFTFAIAVLESIGAFRDLGIVLSAVGLLVGIVFGLTASTRSSVTILGVQLCGVGDDVRAVGGDVRDVSGEVRAVGAELREVRRILDERLPRLS